MESLACWLTMAGLVSCQGSATVSDPLDRIVRIRPELPVGMEWLYRGTVSENYQSGQAEYSRAYRLETRALAMGERQGRRSVAILTQLRERENGRPPMGQVPGTTVSLQVCGIDDLGRLQDSSTEAGHSVMANAMSERGMFLEVPPGGISMGDIWETPEKGLPVVRWRATARETVQAIPCLKIEGEQVTAEWHLPRADRPSWRRSETVWLGLRNGVAVKVERRMERREPARDTTTETRLVRYELDSSIQYPSSLLGDRMRDIDLAWNLSRAAEPLLKGRAAPEALAVLLKKADSVSESPSTSPYRAAMSQVRRSIDSARKGELPPPDIKPVAWNQPAVSQQAAGALAAGRPAPDFLAPFLRGGTGSANLSAWKDQPLLMVFVQPGTPVAEQVLLACKEWKASSGGALSVVVLAIKPEARNIDRLTRDTSFIVPILDGSGLRISYAVESTPRLVLLDSRHQCVGIFDGWGVETRIDCSSHINRLLKSKPTQ